MSMFKFINENALEIDKIHDLKLNNDISINDLLSYIIITMTNYSKRKFIQDYVLNGKQYRVSIEEIQND